MIAFDINFAGASVRMDANARFRTRFAYFFTALASYPMNLKLREGQPTVDGSGLSVSFLVIGFRLPACCIDCA